MKKIFILLYCLLMTYLFFYLGDYIIKNLWWVFTLPIIIPGFALISLAYISGGNEKTIDYFSFLPWRAKDVLVKLGTSFKRDFPWMYKREGGSL